MGAVCCAVVVFSAACRGPLELSNIQVGRSLNQDRSVGAPSTRFKPTETVYVSIHTTARGKGIIGVRWKYGNHVIDEPTKTISTDGPDATEFHLQNSGGFPVGDYTVEVFIDGKSVGTRNFSVDDKNFK